MEGGHTNQNQPFLRLPKRRQAVGSPWFNSLPKAQPHAQIVSPVRGVFGLASAAPAALWLAVASHCCFYQVFVYAACPHCIIL